MMRNQANCSVMKSRVIISVSGVLLIAIVVFLSSKLKNNNNVHNVLFENGYKLYYALDNLYSYNPSSKKWKISAKDIDAFLRNSVDLQKNRIVFFDHGKYQIVAVDLVTKYRETVVQEDGICSLITLSSDLAWVGYSLLSNTHTYYLLNLKDNRKVEITLPQEVSVQSSNVSWSPESKHLLFSVGGGIYLYDVASEKLEKIVDGFNVEFISDEYFLHWEKQNNQINYYKSNIYSDEKSLIFSAKSVPIGVKFDTQCKTMVGIVDNVFGQSSGITVMELHSGKKLKLTNPPTKQKGGTVFLVK